CWSTSRCGGSWSRSKKKVGVEEAGQLLPEHGVGGDVGINIDPPHVPFAEDAQEPFYDEIVFRFLHDNHDDGDDRLWQVGWK
ncbi:hypothetical protein TSUD_258410, partial [Trifolium subterraneum]